MVPLCLRYLSGSGAILIQTYQNKEQTSFSIVAVSKQTNTKTKLACTTLHGASVNFEKHCGLLTLIFAERNWPVKKHSVNHWI